MTYEDLVKILTLISNSYPGKFKYPTGNEEDDEVFEESWFDFLERYPYPVVKIAFRKLIVKQITWPPTIGELVLEIEKSRMSAEEKITGEEAWAIVQETLETHSIFEPEKLLDSLPDRVRKTVGIVGFKKIAWNDDADTFLRSSFIKVYEEIKQEDLEIKMLPGKFTGKYPELKSSQKEVG